MKKIIFRQTLLLCISLTMHFNVINAMKTPINKINNYQEIAVQDLLKKLKLESRFSCYICHKEFARKDYLTKHMKIHTRKKSYSCLSLELRIKNAFVKQFNTRVPTQHFTYMPLEHLPFEAAIQELEWIQ